MVMESFGNEHSHVPSSRAGGAATTLMLMLIPVLSLALAIPTLTGAAATAAYTVDDLPDLTGGVVLILFHHPQESFGTGGELFPGGRLSSRSSTRYLIRVRNQTGRALEAQSLVIVIDKIQEAARLRDVTNSHQIEVRGADGYTRDGKPYFRVPMGARTELEPYGLSEVLVVEIYNPDLLRLYPPIITVRGLHSMSPQLAPAVLGQ